MGDHDRSGLVVADSRLELRWGEVRRLLADHDAETPAGARPRTQVRDGELFIPGEVESREETVGNSLRTWWAELAEKEVGAVVPKAVEYGAADLEVMGTAMLALLPKDKRSRVLGLEMAISFYLLGKVARLFGAYERGEQASADTWADAAIYTRMGQRVREVGSWPGL